MLNTKLLLFCTCLLFAPLAYAVDCQYGMNVACPPSDDPQSFIDEFNVQLNGGVGGADPACPPVARISWDWGDGNVNDSWFPAPHTYSGAGDFTVTVTAFDGDNNALISDNSCVVSIACETDADCDDGMFCTGQEACFDGACGAVSACPPAIDGCVIRNYSCDEDNDQCVDFPDDSFCSESEMCAFTGDCVPIFTCAGFYAPFDGPMVVKQKSNKALPLKFELFDGFVEIMDLSPPPIVEVRLLGNTGSDIPGWDGEFLPAGLSDNGDAFFYDLDSGKWVLNLGMKAYKASNTYEISVVAGDDSYAIDGCSETFTREN